MDVLTINPAETGFHGTMVMIMVGFALVLFASEKLPLASASLVVLVILCLIFETIPFETSDGRLRASDLLLGFGHQALIAVCALMVAGQGLVRTGALQPIGHQLARWWQYFPKITFLLTLLVAAVLSAFMNNTPIVILLLPILISVSLKTATPASDLLMPLGLVTSIGGMATTVGTSTNLVVVAVAADMGMRQFGMFDFALPAVIAGSLGILYLWLIAPRLIPNREPRLDTVSPRLFDAQLRLHADSKSNGKKLSEVIEMAGGNLEVLNIVRGEENNRLVALPDITLREGDRIIVRQTPDRLKEMEQLLGARLYAGDQRIDDEHPLSGNSGSTEQIAEVVVVPGSSLDGRTLEGARFTERYQLMVLALYQSKKWDQNKGLEHSEKVRLNPGDIILVQGTFKNISRLKSSRNLLVLDARSTIPVSNKAPIAVLIMLFIIGMAAADILPIAVSAMTGALLMFLTRCIKWFDATRALDASVILIIVTSLAMGTAMVETGAASYLAQGYVDITANWSPAAILSGLLVLMAMLTNVVSNNAAAVIGTPIAIGIALKLGLPPEPFVLAVIFGANMSFATPMAYQTNLLVMNAGNYRFSDFVRVGVPLVAIMWVVLTFLLPWLYGI